MKLTIQNMVCPRCIESVRDIFSQENIPVEDVSLGRVTTTKSLDDQTIGKIRKRLDEKGFSLVQEREKEIVELIKVQLIKYLEHLEAREETKKLSVFVSENLHYNYSYLSKIFSEHVGETVENYLIRLKIERVKELLDYRRFTLSEIAWKLKYSSVQYLSNQFRKITGQTVTEYLKQNQSGRKSLDHI